MCFEISICQEQQDLPQLSVFTNLLYYVWLIILTLAYLADKCCRWVEIFTGRLRNHVQQQTAVTDTCKRLTIYLSILMYHLKFMAYLRHSLPFYVLLSVCTVCRRGCVLMGGAECKAINRM